MPLAMIAVVLIGLMREQGVPNAPTRIQQLSWLAGCWQQLTSTGATSDEIWMAPEGEMMLGMSRTVARGRVVEYEFMRIHSDGDSITFSATLPKQSETAFRMIEMDRRSVVFENRAHDFPQRVIYHLDGDTLTGRIEGTQNGKPRSVDYPMRRTACR
jgi:hypothetical protein